MPQCLQQPVPFIYLHLGSKHSPPTSISSGVPRYSKRCLNISRRYLNRANYDLIQRQHQEKVKPQPYSKAGHLTQKKILPATKTTPFPVLPTRSASVSCKVHVQSAEFCESFLERTVVRLEDSREKFPVRTVCDLDSFDSRITGFVQNPAVGSITKGRH